MALVFLPVPMTGTAIDVGPVMALAVTDFGEVLVIDDDGMFRVTPMENVRVDLRYDYREAAWIDVSEVPDGGAEEETDDGGEEVSGDVSDPD